MNLEPNPDQKSRMVADALSSLPSDWRPIGPTEAELIIKRAEGITRNAAAVARQLDLAASASGLPPDRKTLSHIIGKEFLSGFGTWSKDELLYLIVFMHTDVAMDSMLGTTDTKKIITL